MTNKIKAINPQIVVHGTVDKPYYEISYYDTTDKKWHIGYSSYALENVVKWLNECFEAIETDTEPVKHGKWDDSFDGITPYCTICGKTHNCMKRTPPFCPNCGARMDGDTHE